MKDKDKMPMSSTRRQTKKKPKDKPKRPLSAYNFFFKEERGKILKVLDAEEGDDVNNDTESPDYLTEEMIKRLKKDGGKVSFEEMGKLIGNRWKSIDPDRLQRYTDLAGQDTERYKKEMQTYNSKQEARMRVEAAVKPPPQNPSWNSSRVDPMYHGSAGRGQMDPSGRYPEPPNGMHSSSAFHPSGMGGYSPYGMDMGYGVPPPMGMPGHYPPPPPHYGYGNEGGMPPSQYGRGGSMYGMPPGYQGGMMGYGYVFSF
mmetsp:Transcript_12558/g.19125  ORF Transcript_12558/g.19125 Transcript_12558/m.19125 type:complete len:257 (+) Transcript_12558:348-1118(+)